MELPKLDIQRVIERLPEHFTDEDIAVWLMIPHPKLDGETPLSAIHNGQATLILSLFDIQDAQTHAEGAVR